MNKFKSALKFTGSMLDNMYEQNLKVKEMTQQIMNRSYGVEYAEAEKIARVLVNHAEVNWK